MADFNYKFEVTSPLPKTAKFEKLYTHRINVAAGCEVFYNEHTITHLSQQASSITILGYVHTSDNEVKSYLADLLRNFSAKRIIEAKRDLCGQYIAIVQKEDYLYLFSDFLQIRSIYYNSEERLVCSSFAALYTAKNDDYKVFEYLAMRHCNYPAWLGNSTLNDQVKRVRPYEYLKINKHSGYINVMDVQFVINNSKLKSLKEIIAHTHSLYRSSIQHSALRNKKIASTITGGFDSRLATVLVQEYYTDTNLRICTTRGNRTLDHTIADQVADALSLPLEVYETDLDTQKETFYFLTDGLSPKENGNMTQLLAHTDNWELGFGGVMGTELYTTIEYATFEELITDYSSRARNLIKADGAYYLRFEQALRDELANIQSHYLLKSADVKDFMRLFRLINTGYFASPVVSAFNIRGNQYELFATFPIIEAGLRIPYEYLGSKLTFGRFYLIPKSIVESIHPKIGKLSTTHFCPMRPLSAFSFYSYVAGKMKEKQYYKQQAKRTDNLRKTLNYTSEHLQYTSNDWYEGFMQTYLGDPIEDV